MPDNILRLDSPAIDAKTEEYYAALMALALLAMQGKINKREYARRQQYLAQQAILAAFLMAGGDLSNPAAAAWLAEQNRIVALSSSKIAKDIYNGRYSPITDAGNELQSEEEGKEKLLERLALWTFVLGAATHRGELIKPGWEADIYGTWQFGATERHCSTCATYNGVRLLRSEWASLAAKGVEPQGRGLQCGGWRCDCKIVWEK